MIRESYLRKVLSFILLAAILCVTAFGIVTEQVLAATEDTNPIHNVKGESNSSNSAYHRLQEATYESRKAILDDYNNRPTAEVNRPQQAAKNVNENTRSAFKRAADSVKGAFDNKNDGN